MPWPSIAMTRGLIEVSSVRTVSEPKASKPRAFSYQASHGQNGTDVLTGLPEGQDGANKTGGRKERWEDIQRSWDLVTEGADGTLAGTVEGLVEAGKRKRYVRLVSPFPV